MRNQSQYLKNIKSLINDITQDLKLDIETMARAIGDVMQDDGIIQLFGWDGDQTLSMELGFRAGGLIQYHRLDVKDLALRKIIREEEFLAVDFKDRTDLPQRFFSMYNIDEKDAFLLTQISNLSNFNDALVKEIKKRNHKLFLITNSHYPNAQKSLAYQEADFIIDLKTPYPDHTLELENGLKVGTTTNLLGNVVAQMLTAEIYTYLKSIDQKPGILISMNVTGADEHNRALGLKYDGRYNS